MTFVIFEPFLATHHSFGKEHRALGGSEARGWNSERGWESKQQRCCINMIMVYRLSSAASLSIDFLMRRVQIAADVLVCSVPNGADGRMQRSTIDMSTLLLTSFHC